jgi:small-conductance mechanosensitive channel
MFHRLMRLAVFVILPLVVATAAAPARAQTAPQGQIAVKDLEGLIKTLDNDAQRKAFVKRLKDLLAAQKATAPKPSAADSLVDTVVKRVRESGSALVKVAAMVTDLPKLWSWLRSGFESESQRAVLIEGAWKTALILALGLIALFATRWLLRRPRRTVEDRHKDTFALRIGYLAIRTLLDLLPVAAFAVVAYAALPVTEPSATASAVALSLIFAFVLAWGIQVVLRMVLAPKAGSLRLPPLGDESAAYLYVWGRRFTRVVVYGYFALVALSAFGLPAAVHDVLLKLVGVVVTILLIVFILQNRRTVAAWLAAEPRNGSRVLHTLGRRLGDIWHIFAILYVIGSFLVWTLEVEGGFAYLLRATVLTALIVVAAMVLVFGLRKLLDRLFRIDADLRRRNPRLEERANRYMPFVRSVVFGVVYAIAVLAIFQAWGVDVVGLLATRLGQTLVGRAVTIIVVLVTAVIVWELINGAIDRYMLRLAQNRRDGERGVRLRTLLPMLEKLILVTMVIVVSLIVLSEIGVNIGPLLAGAGVLGLAIGFGAQTLVKDVITGLFNIIEDSMAVGDIVTVANRTGTVEDLSMRSVVLRDYQGIQHTIPFSSITDVQNLTKDFAYSVMDFGVSYRENVDEVMAVILEVAAEFRKDEAFAANLLGDLEMWGLNELADSAVVIRTRFKCAPGSQWAIRREMNRRVKAAFDARGIEIPFPHVTLYFGEDKEGAAPPANVRIDRVPTRTGKPASVSPAEASAAAEEAKPRSPMAPTTSNRPRGGAPP